jgi:flavodoxin
MNYKIVYFSLTGNTKIIAEAIKDALKKNSCTYCGEIKGSVNHDADILFVGFYVHKSSCPDEIKHYLESLENQKIALFGTAGFGGSKSYFESTLENVKSYIPKSNVIIGNFMCQGKMPENVLERYSKILEGKPGNSEILKMINNYNNALSHPDENDIDEVQIFAKKILSDFNK